MNVRQQTTRCGHIHKPKSINLFDVLEDLATIEGLAIFAEPFQKHWGYEASLEGVVAGHLVSRVLQYDRSKPRSRANSQELP